METKYKAKLYAEGSRHKTMLGEVEATHNRWNEENAALVSSHQSYLKELCSEYEVKLEVEHSLQKKLLMEKDDAQIVFEKGRTFVDNDGDIEITEMKTK